AGAAAGAGKAELRAALRAARRALGGEARAAAEAAVCAHLLAAPALRAARAVGCYAAFDGEVDLAALYAQLAALPRPPRLAFPVHAPGEPLRFFEALAWRARAGSYARPVGPEVPLAALDALLVPGVGFSPSGARLGLGGGFYDRTLAATPQRTSAPLTFGVAFSLQITEGLPVDPWDLRVAALVTELGWALRPAPLPNAPTGRSPI
ncbi:MAG: 5-formyltetrahydrofolate cyclo-ligase, partial [Deltaproteobacteria bacterium]|nr:5-formyltetrahydrofolate cyclo-ligase [Deltaproteobacteria bacterium]